MKVKRSIYFPISMQNVENVAAAFHAKLQQHWFGEGNCQWS